MDYDVKHYLSFAMNLVLQLGHMTRVLCWVTVPFSFFLHSGHFHICIMISNSSPHVCGRKACLPFFPIPRISNVLYYLETELLFSSLMCPMIYREIHFVLLPSDILCLFWGHHNQLIELRTIVFSFF